VAYRWATCPVCGEQWGVNLTGALRRHRESGTYIRGNIRYCAGSRRVVLEPLAATPGREDSWRTRR
jgi:hypothetical protein